MKKVEIIALWAFTNASLRIKKNQFTFNLIFYKGMCVYISIFLYSLVISC